MSPHSATNFHLKRRCGSSRPHLTHPFAFGGCFTSLSLLSHPGTWHTTMRFFFLPLRRCPGSHITPLFLPNTPTRRRNCLSLSDTSPCITPLPAVHISNSLARHLSTSFSLWQSPKTLPTPLYNIILLNIIYFYLPNYFDFFKWMNH